MTPSWPCEVNGSSATSHSTPSPATAFLSAATAWQTRLPGFSASPPSASFRWAGTVDECRNRQSKDPGHRRDRFLAAFLVHKDWPDQVPRGQHAFGDELARP